MFCNSCGAKLAEGVAFCPTCGAATLLPPKPVHPRDLTVSTQGVPVARQTDPLAVGSLACGIAAYLVIPVVGGLCAIVLGHLARGSIRRSSGTREGMGLATVGLVLGYLNLALSVLVVLVIFGAVFGAIAMGH